MLLWSDFQTRWEVKRIRRLILSGFRLNDSGGELDRELVQSVGTIARAGCEVRRERPNLPRRVSRWLAET